MEPCYKHFDHTRNARSSIGGGKSNSVSEKLADGYDGVTAASVANCDVTAGVEKSLSREGRRSWRPLGFNAERSASD